MDVALSTAKARGATFTQSRWCPTEPGYVEARSDPGAFEPRDNRGVAIGAARIDAAIGGP